VSELCVAVLGVGQCGPRDHVLTSSDCYLQMLNGLLCRVSSLLINLLLVKKAVQKVEVTNIPVAGRCWPRQNGQIVGGLGLAWLSMRRILTNIKSRLEGGNKHSKHLQAGQDELTTVFLEGKR